MEGFFLSLWGPFAVGDQCRGEVSVAPASFCGAMDLVRGCMRQASPQQGCVLKELTWGKHEVKRAGMVLAEGHAPYSTDVAGCYLLFHGWINSISQDHCRRAEPMALQPETGASTRADHRGASNLTPKCERATSHPALLKQISGK